MLSAANPELSLQRFRAKFPKLNPKHILPPQEPAHCSAGSLPVTEAEVPGCYRGLCLRIHGLGRELKSFRKLYLYSASAHDSISEEVLEDRTTGGCVPTAFHKSTRLETLE